MKDKLFANLSLLIVRFLTVSILIPFDLWERKGGITLKLITEKYGPGNKVKRA